MLRMIGRIERGRRGGRREKVHAFTLVELLAVLAIVTVLASLVMAGGRRATEAGKVAQTKAQLAALSAALETYRRAHGDYPRTAEGAALLQALAGRRGPGGETVAARGLIDLAHFPTAGDADPRVDVSAELIDAWAQPYVYAYKTGAPAAWRRVGFVLYSCGPDGAHRPPAAGTGDVDATASENADNLFADAP